MQPEGDGAPYNAYRVVVDREERPAESDADAPRAEAEGFLSSPGFEAPAAVCPDCGYAGGEHAPDCLPF